jgi:hypothetical protein
MADLLDKLHIDAALDLLRADAGLTVYPSAEGHVPAEPSPPYVRVYAYIERPPDDPANGLDGRSSAWTTRWYCHCIGANEASATAVAMRVRAALLDVRPTIAGRSCDRIVQEAANPPTRDDSTGSTVLDLVVVYRLMTLPG